MTRTIISIIIASVAVAAHADSELIEAARSNDAAQVKALLESGANTESKDDNGHTALHFAAGNNNVEIARMLVEHGGDVNAVGYIDNTPLLIAAQEGHTEVASILVEGGADIDATDEFGGTSLRYASGRGHRDIADMLKAASVPERDSMAEVHNFVYGISTFVTAIFVDTVLDLLAAVV